MIKNDACKVYKFYPTEDSESLQVWEEENQEYASFYGNEQELVTLKFRSEGIDRMPEK